MGDGEVLIDRGRQRAVVTARPLPGASLATYRELERRASADFEGWTIEVRPPARPLPDIGFEDETPDTDALALLRWGGARVGTPIRLEGPAGSVELLERVLGESGIATIARPTGNGFGTVRTAWAAPDATGE